MDHGHWAEQQDEELIVISSYEISECLDNDLAVRQAILPHVTTTEITSLTFFKMAEGLPGFSARSWFGFPQRIIYCQWQGSKRRYLCVCLGPQVWRHCYAYHRHQPKNYMVTIGVLARGKPNPNTLHIPAADKISHVVLSRYSSLG